MTKITTSFKLGRHSQNWVNITPLWVKNGLMQWKTVCLARMTWLQWLSKSCGKLDNSIRTSTWSRQKPWSTRKEICGPSKTLQSGESRINNLSLKTLSIWPQILSSLLSTWWRMKPMTQSDSRTCLPSWPIRFTVKSSRHSTLRLSLSIRPSWNLLRRWLAGQRSFQTIGLRF